MGFDEINRVKLTEELIRRPWLPGGDRLRFGKSLDHLQRRIGAKNGPVLVAEKGPIDFLAVFFAGLLRGCPVAAGNIEWGRKEWGEAMRITGGRRLRATGEEESFARAEDEAIDFNPGEILIPTGGTGARLRFARHSWESLAAAAEGFCLFFGGQPVNSLCVLPLFHVSGLMQVIRALVSGGELRLPEWDKLRAGKIPCAPEDWVLSLVPTQLRELLEVEELHPWLRKLKAIPLGGAAAPPGLLEQAARLQLPVVCSYGATETAAMATAQTPEEFLSGDRTSGRPLPHVSIRTIGPNGENSGPGKEGRVCVGGASLFHGYAPGNGRSGQEWITGDLGWLCDGDRLIIIGREDRAVVTGGEKVSPEEVERVLLNSGLVTDVFVCGVEDAKWGAAVAAVYVPGGGVAIGELRAFARKEMAPYKSPKQWVPVKEIPRTAQGKIDRERVNALLSGGHPEDDPDISD